MAAIVGLGEISRVKPSGPSGRVEAIAEGLDRLEVGTGAERHVCGACEDHHPSLVVGHEGPIGLVKQLRGGAVDGVAALRAVDGHHRRGAPALVAHLLHGPEL